jgi:hypothetical protein
MIRDARKKNAVFFFTSATLFSFSKKIRQMKAGQNILQRLQVLYRFDYLHM